MNWRRNNNLNPHPDPLPSKGRGGISSPRLRGEDQGEGEVPE